MRQGLSVREAQELVLEATPVLGAETVATREAQGRILAEDVTSARTLPPSDCSAMNSLTLLTAPSLSVSIIP